MLYIGSTSWLSYPPGSSPKVLSPESRQLVRECWLLTQWLPAPSSCFLAPGCNNNHGPWLLTPRFLLLTPSFWLSALYTRFVTLGSWLPTLDSWIPGRGPRFSLLEFLLLAPGYNSLPSGVSSLLTHSSRFMFLAIHSLLAPLSWILAPHSWILGYSSWLIAPGS